MIPDESFTSSSVCCKPMSLYCFFFSKDKRDYANAKTRRFQQPRGEKTKRKLNLELIIILPRDMDTKKWDPNIPVSRLSSIGTNLFLSSFIFLMCSSNTR